MEKLQTLWSSSGLAQLQLDQGVMILVGLGLLFLAIRKRFEPLLLVPIGFGMLVGNVPLSEGMNVGIYEEGSVLSILYQGVTQGWYPPLIFLGIGAMTDFSSMLSNPRLILLGDRDQLASVEAGAVLGDICGPAPGFSPTFAGQLEALTGAEVPAAVGRPPPRLPRGSQKCIKNNKKRWSMPR